MKVAVPPPAATLTRFLETCTTGPVSETLHKTALMIEILAWFPLVLRALTFSAGSILLLAVYTCFLRIRFHCSKLVQKIYKLNGTRIDKWVASAGPGVQHFWNSVKHGLTYFVDSTRSFLPSVKVEEPK